jgi:hypothetical protein
VIILDTMYFGGENEEMKEKGEASFILVGLDN